MIAWTESVTIFRPTDAVYAAVRDQRVLMQWSAWPAATGYSCAVEGDGVSVGSSVVFRTPNGQEIGRQTMTVVNATEVRNRLRNLGPGGRPIEPEVDFWLTVLGPSETRVALDFRVSPPIPKVLHPVARFYLTRRIRPLHRQDLLNLKTMLEADNR